MEVPKTIIIGLNLHGEIPIDTDGNPNTMTVKNNYIVKLNLVSPGVPNISTFENYSNLSNVTNKIIQKSGIDWSKKRNKIKINDLVNDIKEKLKMENLKNFKEINDYIKIPKNESSGINEHMKNFLRNYDNSFEVYKFDKGDSISNKLLYKFTTNELKAAKINKNTINEEFINKIFIYNIEGTPDIFELLKLLGHETNSITLFDLIEFFENFGVDNIVFIDFSCSVFKHSNHKKVSERQIRQTRREIRKMNTFTRKNTKTN
jgi:hypothetical protein